MERFCTKHWLHVLLKSITEACVLLMEILHYLFSVEKSGSYVSRYQFIVISSDWCFQCQENISSANCGLWRQRNLWWCRAQNEVAQILTFVCAAGCSIVESVKFSHSVSINVRALSKACGWRISVKPPTWIDVIEHTTP